VTTCLTLLRQACRAPINRAWYELLGAARNDPQLRLGLEPLVARYHAQIRDTARTLPFAGSVPPDLLDTLVFTVVHVFDGEAMSAVVHPQPEQEGLRIDLLAHLLLGVPARGTARVEPTVPCPGRTY
jgi:hypothetical protein